MAEHLLTYRPFTRDDLVACVRDACRATTDWSAAVPDQVRYLLSYLSHPELDAQAILVEPEYTDRHYLAEFQGYYATALRPPPQRCVRLHFFQCELPSDLAGQVAGAAGNEAEFESLRDHYQAAYLGFVVVRPLESAPIGRTVLRAYSGKPSREFGPKSPPHRVHLLGMTLKARGVQFHEQDRAVGACATAAVSGALAAVIRRDGGRSPTTLAITEHANRSTPEGRVFPAAAGLTRQQMIGAILASGYSPDVVKPSRDGDQLLLLAMMMYLRSGIPVVMQLYTEGTTEGHAVIAVGFRTSDSEEPAADVIVPAQGSYELRSRGITRLYVHDDRLGPYARMKWQVEAEKDPAIAFIPYGEPFPTLQDPVHVSCAIAPLYPKIRMSALDVLVLAGELLPVARKLAGPDRRDSVLVEPAFRLAGDYSADLLRLPLDRGRVAALVQRLRLSRYVGVIRFRTGDDWLLDVLCDATDILRPIPKWGQVLAVIPASEDELKPVATYFAGRAPGVLVG